MTINIGDIEIFSQMSGDQLDRMASIFTRSTESMGATVLECGKPVAGLYLLVEGETEVSIPGYDGILATISAGNPIGEMSLFHSENSASATVTVSSAQAQILFCSREKLFEALQADSDLAAGFYHGSALMVADRLRSTNNKISGELSQSIKMATELVDEIGSSEELGSAQNDLQAAGSTIVSRMTTILKTLLTMKSSGEDVPHEKIVQLADSAKEIYYSEFQIFDRMHQQMQQLGDHLENVKRILTQQEDFELEDYE
jgi:CRP-like cAMP-binding protein